MLINHKRKAGGRMSSGFFSFFSLISYKRKSACHFRDISPLCDKRFCFLANSDYSAVLSLVESAVLSLAVSTVLSEDVSEASAASSVLSSVLSLDVVFVSLR